MENMSATTGLNKTSSLIGVLSKKEGIVWCSVYALEAVSIVVGNLVTIVLFAVNRDLRKKSLYLIINVAFADLMYGALLTPFDIYFIYVGYFYELWSGNQSSTALNISYHIISFFLVQNSLTSSALISCERFYAVYWPLKHRTLSLREYCIVIFVTWSSSILVSVVCTVLLYFTSTKLDYYITASYFLILLSIVCGCNIGIWRTFRHRGIPSEQPNRALQNKRLTKTLLFVSIIALISWLPITIVNFLVTIYEMPISWHVFHVTVAVNVSNSFVNPLIYALRIPEFRRAPSLLCFTRQAPRSREDHKSRNRYKVAAVTSVNQIKTLGTDSSHLQLATGGHDTKL